MTDQELWAFAIVAFTPMVTGLVALALETCAFNRWKRRTEAEMKR